MVEEAGHLLRPGLEGRGAAQQGEAEAEGEGEGAVNNVVSMDYKLINNF